MTDHLRAYIPQDRRHALARGVDLPDRAHGAVMFADVTGFTRLAEALSQSLGPRRGAEELTALLNQVYTALIAEVHCFGGSVVGFSGDAITCWFDEAGVGGWGLGDGESALTPNLQPRTPSALCALACALAMRQAMAPFAAVPTLTGSTVTVTVKTAIAAGPVRRFLIGDPHIQVLEVLAGRTLHRLAATAQLAERDDVLVDAETLAQLGAPVAVAAWREDADTGSARRRHHPSAACRPARALADPGPRSAVGRADPDHGCCRRSMRGCATARIRFWPSCARRWR